MVKAKKGSGTSKRYKGNLSSGESRSLHTCWDVKAVSWHGGGGLVGGITGPDQRCAILFGTLLILQGQTESVSGIK
jgi:hypothetical protein